MKKVLLLLMVIAVGCGVKSDQSEKVRVDPDVLEGKTYIQMGSKTTISIFKMDECEYLLARVYSEAPSIVHHGNCHNPIHKK